LVQSFLRGTKPPGPIRTLDPREVRERWWRSVPSLLAELLNEVFQISDGYQTPMTDGNGS
jgi:hypothetical protein